MFTIQKIPFRQKTYQQIITYIQTYEALGSQKGPHFCNVEKNASLEARDDNNCHEMVAHEQAAKMKSLGR